MYKVLIVEDEDIIRRGLVFSLHWDDLDCAVVADCANGEEGVLAIRRYNPDIVITDISMPVMDGLKMIQNTYEMYEYAAIILSGYSDFEYAQSAIRYGVLGYLLKPLRKQELREAVERAKKECQRRDFYKSHQSQPLRLAEDFIKEFRTSYSGNDKVVHQMMDFVTVHYQQKILMSDLQKELNYSDTFLNKKFKEAIGTTFMEYVNRYRIRQAIDMMSEQNMTLQDIAWKCGIGEYKYFNIVFKKYLGCSPREYMSDMGLWKNQ